MKDAWCRACCEKGLCGKEHFEFQVIFEVCGSEGVWLELRLYGIFILVGSRKQTYGKCFGLSKIEVFSALRVYVI